MEPGWVPDHPATGVWADGTGALFLLLPGASARQPGSNRAAERAGGGESALWLARLTILLRPRRLRVNAKRVYRIYRQERPGGADQSEKEAGGAGHGCPWARPERENQRWSMDFMMDRLWTTGVRVADDSWTSTAGSVRCWKRADR